MKNISKVFFLLFTVLFCFSCSNLGLLEKTGIKIQLPAAGSRAVSATQPMEFVLTALNNSSKKETTALGKSGETITVELDAGTYTVTIKAYAEADTEHKTVLFAGTEEDVKVVSGVSTEVELKLKRQLFTVTFIDEDEESSIYININSNVSEPEVSEKTGYTFSGWYNGEEKFDFTTPITSDLTLTAKWQLNAYKIKFVAEETTEQTVNHGEKIKKPEDPVKEGFVFLGWFNGDEAYDFNSEVTADLILTAKWQEKIESSISIKFDSVTNDKLKFNMSETSDSLVIEVVSDDSDRNYLSYTWLIDGVIQQKEKSNKIELNIAEIAEKIDRIDDDVIYVTCIAYRADGEDKISFNLYY